MSNAPAQVLTEEQIDTVVGNLSRMWDGQVVNAIKARAVKQAVKEIASAILSMSRELLPEVATPEYLQGIRDAWQTVQEHPGA